MRAEPLHQRLGVRPRQISHRPKAGFQETRRHCRPDAWKDAHGSWSKEGLGLAGPDHGEASGLVEVRSNFCEKLVGGKTDRDGKSRLVLDLRLQFRQCYGWRRLVQPLGAGKVHPGLVERQVLNERRQARGHAKDALAFRAVLVEVRLDHHRLWAKLQGPEHGHRRTHALNAGDVAAGRHDPALAPADDHGLVAKFWSVAFFDGCIKSVAVHVGYAKLRQLLMRYDPRRAACGAAPARRLALPKAVATEGQHQPGSSGQSQAAPRTPDESPCTALRTGVVNTSENV